jgi:aminopeptidase N
MAHPVRPDAYLAIDNFYTATVYEKGAEVVRMMHTLVGDEGFARGISLYFQRHDGQAVTCDDFAQAIADANPGSALTSRLDGFKRWYAQSGTPRVIARGRWDAHSRSYNLGLEQQCAPTPGQPEKQPFVIPVAIGLLDRQGQRLPLRTENDPDAPLQRLLVLDEHRAFYTFTDIDSDPVPSLLQGFSAPVGLVDNLGEPELLVQLQHDADAFNRWEASQRLAAMRLRAAHDSATNLVDGAYADALRRVIRDPALDAALKALVLTLPSESWTAESTAEADPQRIHAAHERLRAELAAQLHDEWLEIVEGAKTKAGYEPKPEQAGRRALVNLALEFVALHAVHSGDDVWQGRIYQRFKDAGNMTDRLGALEALQNAHSSLAAPALERFHDSAGHDALMIDKWFLAQSGASESVGDHGRVFHRLRGLLSHPQFTVHNPNRLRALLSNWMLRNPAAFHRSDAGGYVVWADQVVAVDAINPVMAARLARAMDRWSHLAEPYRSGAREAIARVASRNNLSPDVREIVAKALEAA